MKLSTFVDQMGQTIQLQGHPCGIISLVPSQTELLFDLGLQREIVGVTRYCVAPSDKVADCTTIGGTKRFHFDLIDQLQPDLIIGNKEENYPEGIARLRKSYPVWMSDIHTLSDALEMIEGVGKIVHRSDAASELITEIRAGFEAIGTFPPLRVAYLIWKNPYMVAGSDTFIHEMLQCCGLENVFGHQRRYPQITIDNLKDAEVILLSSEPYPFGPADVEGIQVQFSNQKVGLVDGTMFSWYGSRLKHAPQYFRKLRSTMDREHSFDLRH